MAETVNVKNIGLRGVTVADTAISLVDGVNGVLVYRGYRIEDLAANASFPETAFLLLNGHLPDREELKEFQSLVMEARDLPGHIIESLRTLPRKANPMDVLQASVPLLAMADPDLGDIVEMFVEEIPHRTATLLDQFNASDWEGVRRTAHQLKGAAGSYGFSPISDCAAELEQAVCEDEPEEQIRDAVDALVGICNRVRGGTPT